MTRPRHLLPILSLVVVAMSLVGGASLWAGTGAADTATNLAVNADPLERSTAPDSLPAATPGTRRRVRTPATTPTGDTITQPVRESRAGAPLRRISMPPLRDRVHRIPIRRGPPDLLL